MESKKCKGLRRHHGYLYLVWQILTGSSQEVSGKRTEETLSLIKRLGGKVKDVYVLMGPTDLIFILDFPGIAEALQASLALTRLTGVRFSTSPAIQVEEFDKIATGI